MPREATIKRELLLPPPNPMRISMDDGKLLELTESIRKHGILSPLLVCEVMVPPSNGESREVPGSPVAALIGHVRYEIIDGHRRYVASGMAGLADLPCRIFDNVAECKYAIMLDATSCHEDFTPAEEGVQFLELIERFAWTLEETMRHFGRSEDYINERVRMVQQFPEVSEAVGARSMNWSQAKQVMRVQNLAQRQYMIDQVVTHGASTRTLIYMVDQFKTAAIVAAGGSPVHTPEHAKVITVEGNPRCLWCDRDDDPQNIVDAKVHSYHKRDLEEFLKRLGVNRLTPA